MKAIDLLGVFIIFPLGAAGIGFLYLRMFFKLKCYSCFFTGSIWIAYAIYETLMLTRVLCTGECNIRIDLLLIYPLLLISSLLASGLYFWRRKTFIQSSLHSQESTAE